MSRHVTSSCHTTTMTARTTSVMPARRPVATRPRGRCPRGLARTGATDATYLRRDEVVREVCLRRLGSGETGVFRQRIERILPVGRIHIADRLVRRALCVEVAENLLKGDRRLIGVDAL